MDSREKLTLQQSRSSELSPENNSHLNNVNFITSPEKVDDNDINSKPNDSFPDISPFSNVITSRVKRGRPPGSKNKPKVSAEKVDKPSTLKKRGRPPKIKDIPSVINSEKRIMYFELYHSNFSKSIELPSSDSFQRKRKKERRVKTFLAHMIKMIS